VKQFFAHPAVSFILKVLVSILLFTGLLYYIDVKVVIASFKNAHPIYLIIGFLLIVANIGLHYIRWRYLLRLISPEVKNMETFTSLVVGITTGFFTPAQIGEIAGRIACHPNLRRSHIAGMTLIDKLYIFALTFVIGIIALSIFAFHHLTEYWHSAYAIITIASSITLTIIFWFPHYSKKILTFVPQKIREHRLYNVIEIFETQFHNREGRILFLLTGLLYTIIFIQYYIFAMAFEPVPFWDTFICSSSVYFVKAFVLPISIGDLGVRESAAVFFFSKIGVSAAAAFSASFCMFLANIFLPSVLGAIMVLKLKSK